MDFNGLSNHLLAILFILRGMWGGGCSQCYFTLGERQAALWTVHHRVNTQRQTDRPRPAVRFKPGTVLLCDDSANHCTAMLPQLIMLPLICIQEVTTLQSNPTQAAFKRKCKLQEVVYSLEEWLKWLYSLSKLMPIHFNFIDSLINGFLVSALIVSHYIT